PRSERRHEAEGARESPAALADREIPREREMPGRARWAGRFRAHSGVREDQESLMNYYNENDRNAAAWLRELIGEGLIPDGHVDERSIADVRPDDLAGFRQCHFFAGIGGWSLALSLADWPEDR